jgi:hypothetical protein
MHRWPVLSAAAAVTLAAALGLPTAALAADDTPPQLVSVQLLPSQADVGVTGTATVTVAVHLRDAEGLPDRLQVGGTEGDDYTVVAAVQDVTHPVMGSLGWYQLNRVSGTPQDGVWQAATTISPAWTGTYTIHHVRVDDDVNGEFYFPVTNGATVTVSGGDRWSVETVRTPIKIVSGKETWRPQARIRNATTGAAIPGARIDLVSFFGEPDTLGFVGPTPPPGTAADGTGLWTSTRAYSVVTESHLEARTYAYGKRGSRGYTQQGYGCPDFTMKLQASEAFSATTLGAGRQLTVTGNVWPAPAVLHDINPGGPLWLQQDLGGGNWQTVAAARQRVNGRYTLTWTPPEAALYSLRVRAPGSGSGATCSGQDTVVGTALIAVPVTVR